jgi:hypothetical protein
LVSFVSSTDPPVDSSYGLIGINPSAVTLLSYIQQGKAILGVSEGTITSSAGSFPIDGSVIWQIAHCTAGLGCPTDPTNRPIDFNLRSIPTIDIVVDSVTWQITYLLCTPGAQLETREIESGAQSTLTVLPSPSSPLARQNNLESTQTNLLLSGVFNNIDGGVQSDAAGPPLLLDAGLGPRLQNAMIFGLASLANLSTDSNVNTTTTTLTPLSASDITQAYTRILTSAAKYFMVSDSIGTASVPGFIASEEAIFSASTPYIVISSVLFGVLSVLAVGAQWRTAKGERFTIIGLGGVLHSDCAVRVLGEAKRDAEVNVVKGAWKGSSVERDCNAAVVRRLGERMVSLRKTTNGEALCINSL